MSILVLVFFLNLVALSIGRRGTGLREAAVRSFILLFFSFAMLTELLSAVDALTFRTLSLSWLALVCASGLAVARGCLIGRCRAAVAGAWDQCAATAGEVRLCVVFVATILGVTLAVALRAPPNNWDSMTYHMARVSAWIQHGNVDFYSTNIDRQNFLSPLTEFAILHLQVLSRSDVLAGLVQWSSLAACILLASLVVKELKQPFGVQVFAALATATIPMAMLQGSSTQNDVACGAFCLAFGYYLLKLVRESSFEHAFFCGASLGWALLTKGTAYVFCPAIALSMGGLFAVHAGRETWRRVPRLMIVVVLAVLAINCGYWSRSYALYGAPVSSGSAHLRNEHVSILIVSANVVRNAALHLGVPQDSVNDATAGFLAACLGNQVNNPDSTWAGTRFLVRYAVHEDMAGNLVHLLLIVAALASLPWIARERRLVSLAWAGAVVGGAVLFSSLFKWQPWSSRLHTPLFLLAMPLVAVACSEWRVARQPVLAMLGTLLFVLGLPFLLYNETRPLVASGGRSVLTSARAAQYFVSRPGLRESYAEAVRTALAGNPAEVGLMLGSDDWEYPLWVLAGKHAVRRAPVFLHVDVTDRSGALERAEQLPDVIIATRRPRATDLEGQGYQVVYGAGPVCVLARHPSPARITAERKPE